MGINGTKNDAASEDSYYQCLMIWDLGFEFPLSNLPGNQGLPQCDYRGHSRQVGLVNFPRYRINFTKYSFPFIVCKVVFRYICLGSVFLKSPFLIYKLLRESLTKIQKRKLGS